MSGPGRPRPVPALRLRVTLVMLHGLSLRPHYWRLVVEEPEVSGLVTVELRQGPRLSPHWDSPVTELGPGLDVVLLVAAAGLRVVVVSIGHLDPDTGGALTDDVDHLVVGQLGHVPPVDRQQTVAGLEADPLCWTAGNDGAEDAGILTGESEPKPRPASHHVHRPQTSAGSLLPSPVGRGCPRVQGEVVVAKLEIILR